MATAKKAAADDGPVVIELADDDRQTYRAAAAAVAELGGAIVGVSGRKLTVDVESSADRKRLLALFTKEAS